MNIITALFLVLITAATASGAPQGVGLGVILGDPTGFTFKTWTGRSTAVDAAAAWSFSGNDAFQLHVDYLINPFYMPKPREVSGRISFYYGIGARLKLQESHNGNRNDNDDLFGVRFPVGFSHILTEAPFEFFAEIAPIVDVVPDTDADFNAAIGARYYFK
jgi:hypothetical protein